MRKQDFIKRRKEFEKRFKRNDWIYSTVFILLILANYFIVSVWDLLPEDWAWFYLIIFFAFLFGNIFVINKFHAYQINRSGLNCRSCKDPLMAEQADIAVATDNCPMCGESAFR